MDKVKYWLWLTEVFGIGSERLWTAMQCFDDPAVAYWELCRDTHGLKLNQKELSNIRSISLESCMKLIEIYKEHGISVTGFSSREYPQYLKNIYNPPAVLFYKGDIECLNRMPAITIVGARRSSNQSLMIADRLARELAQSGFIIVSGFARGTDINSHLGAVSVGCPTVCVMACGLDVDYPRENFIYRDSILKNGGVFISEYPLGTPPLQQNFPKRNRILSGLSRGVVVVEAGEKSGSLITAELALEQNREVFCVPPANIYDKSYAGNIKFLRDGAVPVYGYEDITGYFNLFDDDEVIPETDEPDIKSETVPEIPESSENSAESEKVSDLSEFSDIQKEIIRILMQGKTHIDVISDRLGYDVSELIAEITNLEFDDVIQSFPGKIYGLK